MNKNVRIFSLLLVSLFLLMCASSINIVLTEPEENKVLFIGRIILVLDNYDGREGIYKDGIEVAIGGRYGNNAPFFEWTITDSSGYFFFPNAPADGRYEVKGIRFYMKSGTSIAITRNFLDLDSREQYHFVEWDNIMFSGKLFNKTAMEPDRRIVNLKHNLFIIRTYGNIEHWTIDQNLKYIVPVSPVSFDVNLDTPIIYDYFIENEAFENSAWLPFLKKLSPNYK